MLLLHQSDLTSRYWTSIKADSAAIIARNVCMHRMMIVVVAAQSFHLRLTSSCWLVFDDAEYSILNATHINVDVKRIH